MDRAIDIGIIAMPSLRTVAYFSVLEELEVYPKEIILMGGSLNVSSELLEEADKYNYAENYFDINKRISYFLDKWSSELTHLDVTDINSPDVLNAISEVNVETLVFTGGGIVKEKLLSAGKQLIHIHPGIVPDFRGSTCFYYSLLDRGSLGATAFIMNTGLDMGNVIEQLEFKVTTNIAPDQKGFMDHIMDSHIRAQTLKKVIQQYISRGSLDSKSQAAQKRNAYYVMHPLLRHLTIEKINKNNSAEEPNGIQIMQ